MNNELIEKMVDDYKRTIEESEKEKRPDHIFQQLQITTKYKNVTQTLTNMEKDAITERLNTLFPSLIFHFEDHPPNAIHTILFIER